MEKAPDKPAIIWEGEGIKEIGRRSDTNEIVIRIDPRYFRPTEVDQLIGDSSKARKKLGWTPEISFEKLIEEMIKNDKEIALKDSILENTVLDEIISKESFEPKSQI